MRECMNVRILEKWKFGRLERGKMEDWKEGKWKTRLNCTTPQIGMAFKLKNCQAVARFLNLLAKCKMLLLSKYSIIKLPDSCPSSLDF